MQAAHAAHRQPGVHHRHRVVGAAHAAGAHGVEDGGADVTGQTREFFIALELRTRLEFLRPIPRQRRLADDAARQAQRLRRHQAVFGRAQVARLDQRGGPGVGAGDAHLTARRGVQVAHAGGEGVEAVQRLAEGRQRQGLHVVLHVGPGAVGRRAGKGPQLRGRHAHRPGALEQVLQADQGLAEGRGRHGVERLHTLHAIDGADLQVVLQVLAHAGQLMQRRDAMRVQQGCRAHARQLQDLRRAQGARSHDHATAGPGAAGGTVGGQQFHAFALQLPVGAAGQHQALHLGAGPDLQVGTLDHRAQESLGGVPAQAAALVHLEIAHALVVAGVEVLRGRDAALLRRLRERVQDVPAHARPLDAPLAPAAMQLAGAAPVVLVRLEHRQAVRPAPGRVAREFGPGVVVTRLTSHVDHAVDAGTAAQHLATGVAQPPAVQPRVGLGGIQPVGARVADAVQITHRDVDPDIVVLPPSLDQQDAALRVGTEPVGQQTAGRAGPHHDVVVYGKIVAVQGRLRLVSARFGWIVLRAAIA